MSEIEFTPNQGQGNLDGVTTYKEDLLRVAEMFGETDLLIARAVIKHVEDSGPDKDVHWYIFDAAMQNVAQKTQMA